MVLLPLFIFCLFIDFLYEIHYNDNMVILGFDPGIATLGYGVINKEKNGKIQMLDYGIVSTPKEDNLAVRLTMLERGITQVIEKFIY